MSAYIYIVECADGTLYTGWTVDVEERLRAHNEKRGAKYTKARGPVKLVYMEDCGDRRRAQRREYAVKRLTREQKLALIQQAR